MNLDLTITDLVRDLMLTVVILAAPALIVALLLLAPALTILKDYTERILQQLVEFGLS